MRVTRLLALVGPLVLAASCAVDTAVGIPDGDGGMGPDAASSSDSTTEIDAAGHDVATVDSSSVTDAATIDASDDAYDAAPPCGADAGALCSDGASCSRDGDCSSNICGSVKRKCVAIPPAPSPGTSITSLTAGSHHTCALWSDGVAKCWGDNTYGQLGTGDTIARGKGPGEMGAALDALAAPAGLSVTGVGASNNQTCVHFSDGTSKCFGPPPIPSVSEPGHTCVVVNEGVMGKPGWKSQVFCSGANDKGQLGQGDTSPRAELSAVDMGTSYSNTNPLLRQFFVRVGRKRSCAFMREYSNKFGMYAKCWGDNSRGQLGVGDANNRGDDPGEMGDALAPVGNSPLLFDGWYAPPTTDASAFILAETRTCIFLRMNGAGAPPRFACWGANSYGELGRGNAVDGTYGASGAAPSPAFVNGIDLGTTSGLPLGRPPAFGENHFCAVIQDVCPQGNACPGPLTKIKCWGRNDKGQLGLGDTNHRGDEPNEMGDALPEVKLR